MYNLWKYLNFKNNFNTLQACAPRWHIFDSTTSGVKDHALGLCFAAKAPEYKFTAFSPPYITDISKLLELFFFNQYNISLRAGQNRSKDRKKITPSNSHLHTFILYCFNIMRKFTARQCKHIPSNLNTSSNLVWEPHETGRLFILKFLLKLTVINP